MNKVGLYWQREKVRGRGGPLLAMPSGGQAYYATQRRPAASHAGWCSGWLAE